MYIHTHIYIHTRTYIKYIHHQTRLRVNVIGEVLASTDGTAGLGEREGVASLSIST